MRSKTIAGNRKINSKTGRATAGILAASMVALGVLVGTAGTAAAVASAVPLGTAADFAVLAGSGITNTGPTTISGDVGTDPTPAITGQDSITLTGAYHQADDVSLLAKSDLLIGYNNAAGQADDADPGTELGGQTLVAGVYGTSAALGLTGPLTLDGGGKNDGVWIFKTASTLITASSSSVVLTNGAQACNVYWQVGVSATFGTDTSFVGTVMAATSITATTGATFEGRLLASDGAVTLDTNTISQPGCETDTPTSDTPTSDTPTSDTPTSDTPTSDTPTSDTPTSDTPTSDTPTSDTPTPTEVSETGPSAPTESTQSTQTNATNGETPEEAAARAAAEAAQAAAERAAAEQAAAQAAQAAADSAAAQAAAEAAAAQAAAEAAATGTSQQVPVVPVGSLDTGDGSSIRG